MEKLIDFDVLPKSSGEYILYKENIAFDLLEMDGENFIQD